MNEYIGAVAILVVVAALVKWIYSGHKTYFDTHMGAVAYHIVRYIERLASQSAGNLTDEQVKSAALAECHKIVLSNDEFEDIVCSDAADIALSVWHELLNMAEEPGDEPSS